MHGYRRCRKRLAPEFAKPEGIGKIVKGLQHVRQHYWPCQKQKLPSNRTNSHVYVSVRS